MATKPSSRDKTRNLKLSHEIRRVEFLRKFVRVVKGLKTAADEIRAGVFTEDGQKAVYLEVNRLVGSLETNGKYREAEIAAEIKELLAPSRAVTKRSLGRLDFLVAELERVAAF